MLGNPAPGVMIEPHLVPPHVTREGTETPKRGQLSHRVQWWYLRAWLLHVVASVRPGITAAHGCSGFSPRTHGHGQGMGVNLHISAVISTLARVFFLPTLLSVRHLYPMSGPHEERGGA